MDLAAVNGPASLTVSGDEEAIAALEERLRGEGRKVKRLLVSHAFHSHRMEPMLAEFTTLARSLTYHEPLIPVVSTVSGVPDPELATPEYWVRQVRRPVRFADAVRTLRERDVTQLLELGPDGVLTALAESGVAALRRGRPERETLLAALARLHAAGVRVDWRPLLAGAGRVPLPGYAFDHRRYWPAVRTGPHVDSWRHQVTWTPLSAGADPVLDGTWAVLGPRSDALVTEVVRTVERHGGTVVDRIGGNLAGIVSLLGLGEAPGPMASGLAETVDLLRGVGAPLWCLTRGAVSTGDADPVTDPGQAQVWGLGRVAALEHPERWGGLIDLPAEFEDRTGDLLAAVLAGLGEDQVALRATGLFARRLTTAPAPAAGPVWRPSGPVLITGGTGALGGHAARWLAGRGAGQLVLTSRSGSAAPGVAELVAELA
ncbi:acyltransferase domain-containing protein, partial [Streptomyces sp. ACA25]|uniref:acyltransferase domain-containing protein n=1 Tax=Streptomyces sp. ACA25 TaxID=3022596 RepID=UPI002307106C